MPIIGVLVALGALMFVGAFVGDLNFVVEIGLALMGIIFWGAAGYFAMRRKYCLIAEPYETIVRTRAGKSILESAEIAQGATIRGELSKDQLASMPVFCRGGRIWVIPMFHKSQTLIHRQYELEIPKIEKNALLCKDGRLADVTATFKVAVGKSSTDIYKYILAAGDRDWNSEETIRKLAFDTCETSLRDTCTQMEYMELYRGREEAGNKIENSVEDDFNLSGLELAVAKLRDVDATKKEHYNENDPQHAQGLTVITKIIEDEKLATKTKEFATEEALKAREVEKEKKIFALDQEKEIAKSEKEKTVKVKQAKDARIAEEESIENQQAVEERQVEMEEKVELAKVEKQERVDIANQKREQASREAEIEKQQSLELAEREKMISVAAKEEERAAAEAKRYLAEQKEEEERQRVETIKVTETAEREKTKTIITEKAEIEKEQLRKEMEANVEKFTQVKEAEAKQEAAEKEALAKLELAKADKESAKLQAEGETAVQMVPVNVDAKKVEIERQRVEVEGQELKLKADYQKISYDLEVRLAEIDGDVNKAKAMADALGQALGQANMTIWGDPMTLQQMASAFFNGQANGKFLQGLSSATPEGLKSGAESIVGSFGKMASALIQKATGVNVPSDTIEALAKNLKVSNELEATTAEAESAQDTQHKTGSRTRK